MTEKKSCYTYKLNTDVKVNKIDWFKKKIYYREYKGLKNPVEYITSKVSSHVHALNKIYGKTDFEGITGIRFEIARLKVRF